MTSKEKLHYLWVLGLHQVRSSSKEVKIGLRNMTSFVPHSYNVGDLPSATPGKCVCIDG